MVFLHGGVPGVTPYASGGHLWGSVLAQFSTTATVLAIDSPGAGGTDLPTGPLTLDAIVAHAVACLERQGIRRAHWVGHDLGGLAALVIAMRHPQLVEALSIVASAAASPSGDMAENLTLAYPPVPRWSRASQAWALERISYSNAHIDEPLLADCMQAAAGEPHRLAVERQASLGDALAASIAAAKADVYEACRNRGIERPVQIILGSHDPLVTVDQSMALFRLIAARQRAAHLHVINRAGSLPFREAPKAFYQLVTAFGAGLRSETR